jgi:hypothetical protein
VFLWGHAGNSFLKANADGDASNLMYKKKEKEFIDIDSEKALKVI